MCKLPSKIWVILSPTWLRCSLSFPYLTVTMREGLTSCLAFGGEPKVPVLRLNLRIFFGGGEVFERSGFGLVSRAALALKGSSVAAVSSVLLNWLAIDSFFRGFLVTRESSEVVRSPVLRFFRLLPLSSFRVWASSWGIDWSIAVFASGELELGSIGPLPKKG